MPSILSNAKYDYLSPPHQTPGTTWSPPRFTADEFWPSSPPRTNYFVNSNAFLHPLVSPLTTPKHLWRDAPPIFISLGEETLADEALVLARRMHQAGVSIVAEQFEGMPHCFGLLMPGSAAGRRFFDGTAAFCRDAVGARLVSSGNLRYIGFTAGSDREIPLDEASPLTDEEVDGLLRASAEWLVEGEEELRREGVVKKARL